MPNFAETMLRQETPNQILKVDLPPSATDLPKYSRSHIQSISANNIHAF
ncbi:MAG TPA: hypothetical protein VHY08_22120 [Bacillota bacterium]|nr:hypothetical protein [Bacillota bacterium]